jgi:hypothetical protein
MERYKCPNQYMICAKPLAVGSKKRKEVTRVDEDFVFDGS